MKICIKLPGLLLGVVFILIPGFLVSQESGTSYEIPKPVSQTFTVGVSIFKGRNLSASNDYLLASLPQMLLSGIQRVPVHKLNPEEHEGFRLRIIGQSLEKERRALSTLYTRQDSFLFNPPTKAEEDRISKDLGAKKGYISFLENLSGEDITLPGELPLYMAEDNQKGILLDHPFPNPALFSRIKNLDFLVWGTLEEAEGYLFLTVHSYNSILDTETVLLQTSGTNRRIQEKVRELTRKIYPQILGEPVGYLNLVTEPSQSTITVNGKIAGLGRITEYPVPAGEVEIGVSLVGYKEETSSIQIKAEEIKDIAFVLEREIPRQIAITTIPSGSRVYLNAEWVGTTPFFFNYQDVPGDLKIINEGFQEESFSFIPGKEPPLSITFDMQPIIVDQKIIRDSKRGEFYKAFGILALSIPIPMYCYSRAENLLFLYQQSNSSSQELLREAEIWYSGYLGTLGVSLFLIADMISTLVTYVTTSTK